MINEEQIIKFKTPFIKYLEDSELYVVDLPSSAYDGLPVEVISKVVHRGVVWCYTESILNQYMQEHCMWFKESELSKELFEQLYGDFEY